MNREKKFLVTALVFLLFLVGTTSVLTHPGRTDQMVVTRVTPICHMEL